MNKEDIIRELNSTLKCWEELKQKWSIEELEHKTMNYSEKEKEHVLHFFRGRYSDANYFIKNIKELVDKISK